jgi:hypothetical protein
MGDTMWQTLELDVYDTDDFVTDRERRMAETEELVVDRRRAEPDRTIMTLAEIKAQLGDRP